MKISIALTFALASSASTFTSISKQPGNTALKLSNSIINDLYKDNMLTKSIQFRCNKSELNLPGALPPVGLFDPLGFANKENDAILLRYHEDEVRHGCVAMLANFGFLVGEKVEGSSFLFHAQVSCRAITHLGQVPTAFWLILIVAISASEAYHAEVAFVDPRDAPVDGSGLMRDDHFPSDVGFDPLGLKPDNPEEIEIMVTKELQYSRLAMLAVDRFMSQELTDGKGIFENIQSS